MFSKGMRINYWINWIQSTKNCHILGKTRVKILLFISWYSNIGHKLWLNRNFGYKCDTYPFLFKLWNAFAPQTGRCRPIRKRLWIHWIFPKSNGWSRTRSQRNDVYESKVSRRPTWFLRSMFEANQSLDSYRSKAKSGYNRSEMGALQSINFIWTNK